MKVLFSYTLPFFLAHGGAQVLTQTVMRELAGLGVEVEPERWWDEQQRGDIIHFIGRPPSAINVRLAHQKRFKTVMTEFLDQTASRTRMQLFGQRLLIRLARSTLGGLANRMAWEVYQELDAFIYCAPHEWTVAQYLFNAIPERGFCIPHGLDVETIRKLAEPAPESDFLVSIATIDERKNSVLLATAAKLARVPVLFLGKPYSEDAPYFRQFKALVDGEFVRYGGFVSVEEKYENLRRARGFALLSRFESGCIAVYEAAAAGLPLFLSNLPWAAKAYPHSPQTKFVKLGSPERLAPQLAEFYKNSHRLSRPTFPILSWREIAGQYLAVYKQILKS